MADKKKLKIRTKPSIDKKKFDAEGNFVGTQAAPAAAVQRDLTGLSASERAAVQRKSMAALTSSLRDPNITDQQRAQLQQSISELQGGMPITQTTMYREPIDTLGRNTKNLPVSASPQGVAGATGTLPTGTPQTPNPATAGGSKWKPEKYSGQFAPTSSYDLFSNAYYDWYGKEITQGELDDSKFMEQLPNDVFRLLPVDRQQGFDAKRLALLGNADLAKVMEYNPNVISAFGTDRLAGFDQAFIKKTLLPFLDKSNPGEAKNVRGAVAQADIDQRPPIGSGIPGSLGGVPGSTSGTPGQIKDIPKVEGSLITPPRLERPAGYDIPKMRVPVAPSDISKRSATEMFLGLSGASPFRASQPQPGANPPQAVGGITNGMPYTDDKLRVNSGAPYNGYGVTQKYGELDDRYASGSHTGTDYGMPAGTPLQSEYGGKVVKVGNDKDYGNYVVVQTADGFTQQYSHLSESNAQVGQQISAGAVVGKTGSTGMSTGPHLHLEVKDSYGNAVDPQTYYGPGEGYGQPSGGQNSGEPQEGQTRSIDNPATGGKIGQVYIAPDPDRGIAGGWANMPAGATPPEAPRPPSYDPERVTRDERDQAAADQRAMDMARLGQTQQQISMQLQNSADARAQATADRDWDKAKWYATQEQEMQTRKDATAQQIRQLEQESKQYESSLLQRQSEFGSEMTQRQSEFGANLTQQEADRGLARERDIGFVGGLPTLERENMIADQEIENMNALAARAYQAAQVALSQGRDDEAKRQFDMSYKLQADAAQFAMERDPASAASKTFRLRGQMPPQAQGSGSPFGMSVNSGNMTGDGNFGNAASGRMGGANFESGMPQIGQGNTQLNPLTAQEVQNSPWTSPGIKSALFGGGMPQASSALPVMMGQSRNSLMPSEMDELNATVQATGMDPRDYWQEAASRSQTGTAQQTQIKKRIPRKVMAGY